MSRLFDKDAFPDRPWVGRGYGRIRLDEALARDLAGIMHDEVGRRIKEHHDIKNAGGDPLTSKLALKRANTIRERVINLIHEQGWEDG
jgi:hypothetical protein